MLMMMMTVIHDIWFAGILWIFVLRPLLILSITIGEMPFIDARDCLFASVYYVEYYPHFHPNPTCADTYSCVHVCDVPVLHAIIDVHVHVK